MLDSTNKLLFAGKIKKSETEIYSKMLRYTINFKPILVLRSYVSYLKKKMIEWTLCLISV